MLSVPPVFGEPVPGFSACTPLWRRLLPLAVLLPVLLLLLQAAAVIARTAMPAIAREPRVRVRIELSLPYVRDPQSAEDRDCGGLIAQGASGPPTTAGSAIIRTVNPVSRTGPATLANRDATVISR